MRLCLNRGQSRVSVSYSPPSPQMLQPNCLVCKVDIGKRTSACCDQSHQRSCTGHARVFDEARSRHADPTADLEVGMHMKRLQTGAGLIAWGMHGTRRCGKCNLGRVSILTFFMLHAGLWFSPAQAVHDRSHVGQAATQVLVGIQAHGGHFDDDGVNARLDHVIQQLRLRLPPHLGQRYQAQPGTHLHAGPRDCQSWAIDSSF